MEFSSEMTWAINIAIVAVMAGIGWFAGGKLINVNTTAWNNEIGAFVGVVLGLGIAYFANNMMNRYQSRTY